MPVRMSQLVFLASLAACVITSAACNVFTPKYEYEEEIYLRLDGSATVNVNASVASLVPDSVADGPRHQDVRSSYIRVACWIAASRRSGSAK